MLRSGGGLAALVAVTLLATSCTGGGDEDDKPEFTEQLAEFEPFEQEQADVGDGAEVAIGPDGYERFVVQWRESDGSKWSEAETLMETDGDVETGGVTAESAGSVAVANLGWYAEGHHDVDSDEPVDFERKDAVVCHDFSCDVVEGRSEDVMLTAGGDFAAARSADDPFAYAVWRDGDDGWGELAVEGLPAGTNNIGEARDVMLLDDGSFVSVVEDHDGGKCSYQLWQTEPHEGAMTEVASTEPRFSSYCPAPDPSTDGETVSLGSYDVDGQTTFSRQGGEWISNEPAQPLEVDPAKGMEMYAFALDKDRSGTVAVGSPDGQRIVTQFRPDGATEWSKPVEVARAPAGQECQSARWESIYQTTAAMAIVHCWPQGSKWGDEYDDTPPPSTGFAVATSGGRRWAAESLVRPAYLPLSPSAEPMLLARGADRSVYWRTKSTRLDILDLPLANPQFDGLLITGDTAIRVSGNPAPTKPCRPTWDVAPITATAWAQGGRFGKTPDWMKGNRTCAGYVADEVDNGTGGRVGRTFALAALDDDNGATRGILKPTPRGWRFTPDDD